jgi:superfamily II DNA/RNA helicase
VDQDFLKQEVSNGKLKLLVGTDAASEGLNLQTLGTLINLDLPWNPTRLEQRKGRIQRIGQKYSTVFVYNMRYRDSVEDKVHEALSERLQDIFSLFGQIPDTSATPGWILLSAAKRTRENESRPALRKAPLILSTTAAWELAGIDGTLHGGAGTE